MRISKHDPSFEGEFGDFMLDLNQVKKILKKPNLNDADAEEIRDACFGIVSGVFDRYFEDSKHIKNGKN